MNWLRRSANQINMDRRCFWRILQDINLLRSSGRCRLDNMCMYRTMLYSLHDWRTLLIDLLMMMNWRRFNNLMRVFN